MKRFLCFFLALLLLVPAAYADGDTVTFRLEGPAATVKVGDTVTVVGKTEEAPVCTSFKVTMTYDPAVLTPTKGTIAEGVKGLSIANTEATYNGQKAVIALAADASKAFEGAMTLFTVEFKVVGTAADANGALIDIPQQEFFDAELKQLGATIHPCRILIEGSGSAGDGDGDGNTGDGSGDGILDIPDMPDPDDGSNDAQPDDGDPDTDGESGDQETETGKEENDKKPTGDWFFTEDEAVHLDPNEDGDNSDDTYYTPEYEKDEDGKTTGVIIYDEEGNKKGELKVEEDDDGHIEVTEQDIPKADESEPSGTPAWVWMLVGGIVILAAGGVTLAILLVKKKNKETPPKRKGE